MPAATLTAPPPTAVVLIDHADGGWCLRTRSRARITVVGQVLAVLEGRLVLEEAQVFRL